MTQPPPRPTTPDSATTTTTTTEAFAAQSIPNPPSAPATPFPDIPLLLPPQPKHRHRPAARIVRSVRAAFRSFPILTAPSCRGIPSLHHLPGLHGVGSAGGSGKHFHGSTRTTGTLYGHRKARITLAFQETPRSAPALLLEIGVPTAKFIQDVSTAGVLRVTLECEKQAAASTGGGGRQLLDEPMWAAQVNGKSVGYAARREATEGDVKVMQLLHAMSMGAGVLPADMKDPADGELTYMRAYFDRLVGSKDAETFYMLNPEGNSGPELTVFFVRT